MNIKNVIFISHILLISVVSIAQNEVDYFIKQTKDTVFCTDLRYSTNSRGEINFLRYVRLDESQIVFQSKKTVPFILTLFMDGKTIDRIPLTPNAKKQIRYTERRVDGALKIYLVHQNNSNSKEATVMYIFYIKMPNGQFIKINKKKNMQTKIIPLLKECQEFLDKYKGNYSNKEDVFIEMIELYNKLCPQSFN